MPSKEVYSQWHTDIRKAVNIVVVIPTGRKDRAAQVKTRNTEAAVIIRRHPKALVPPEVDALTAKSD